MHNTNDHILTDEELHAYVQYEAGNTEYFKMDDLKASAIKQKIESSDINKSRYKESKKAYLEIGDSLETKGSRRNIYLLAAASLIILLTFSYIIVSNNTSSVDNDKSEIIASNFIVNEELENQVNYPVRSAKSLEATPKKGATLEGVVRFSWQKEANEEYLVTIYNNKGIIVVKKEVNSPPFEMHKEWEAGLYYWSLENREENIFWGKFEFFPK